MAFKKRHKINLGRKHSTETKLKMSKTRQNNPNSGMGGKKHSKETKLKMSKSRIGKHLSSETKEKIRNMRIGEMNPNWKDGISFEPYSVDWTETLRRSIRERDHYICQLCSQYGNSIHHIDYNKENCDPKNLINLCKSCNSRVNFNRKHWIKYFMKLLKIKEVYYGK